MQYSPLFTNGYFLVGHAVSKAKIRTYFDVGANIGGFFDFAAQDMAIHAFEPVPSMFDKLSAKYSTRPNIHLNQLGLSDKPSTLENATVVNAWTIANVGESSLEQVPEFKGISFKVTLDTLDNYCDSHKTGIGFLKLDADGYEPRILIGGRKTILRDRPWILCELSYLPERLGDSITDFVSYIINDIGYVFCSTDGSYTLSDPKLMIDHFFPWNTSYDVMLIPIECRSNLPKPQ